MFGTGRSTVYVAAHRGDWGDDPENSLQSLKWAAKLGVDIVELDLKRTRDGQFVVMYDSTLDRTTTGSGPVSDRTLEELKRLNLRAGTGIQRPAQSQPFQKNSQQHERAKLFSMWIGDGSRRRRLSANRGGNSSSCRAPSGSDSKERATVERVMLHTVFCYAVQRHAAPDATENPPVCSPRRAHFHPRQNRTGMLINQYFPVCR
jgi:hypothetical protein